MRRVDAELVDLTEDDHPALEADIRTVMIDLQEKATSDPADFWGIGLVNPNPFGVQVRVSLVAFEERERDYPRQVVDVVTLQGDIDLASHRTTSSGCPKTCAASSTTSSTISCRRSWSDGRRCRLLRPS